MGKAETYAQSGALISAPLRKADAEIRLHQKYLPATNGPAYHVRCTGRFYYDWS
jgi:hypothetical protein